MKHKTSELEGALLDAAVAKAEGAVIEPVWLDVSTIEDASRGERRQVLGAPGRALDYSTDWRHGGPIIERERITVQPERRGDLENEWGDQPERVIGWEVRRCGVRIAYGPTFLVCAMRAYVASRLGDEVDL
jgi:hypothetical protein